MKDDTPTTHREAMSSVDHREWAAAEAKELAACAGQGTWTVIPRDSLPPGTNVLPVKWVYKKKTDENGTLTQHKARITPKGYAQQHGVDYFDVFAHTGKYKSLRALLALAARHDLELNQLDVPTAFVRAPLDEEVYMEMPPGHVVPGHVCRLHRSLYGLKQSPRNWYRLLSAYLRDDLGWMPLVSDPCLFRKTARSGRPMLMFVFVDDMQGAYDRADADEWAETKRALFGRFETKDLGDSRWMLGMRITRDRAARTIKLDQELYVTTALERFGLAQCTTARTPAQQNHGAVEDDRDGGAKPTDHLLYMEKVGTLIYAGVSTRPDIAYAVNALTRHMQAPLHRHMVAADRVFRYLAGTRAHGLEFGRIQTPNESDTQLSAFADADWGSDKSDRKSITGWVARIYGDVISWSSKKQSSVSLSTCEAELYAEATAMQELLWLRGLMKELGIAEAGPSTLYGDNQSAITVTETGVKSERTKHIDIRYHFVTDVCDRGDVKLRWVPTAQQQADILTKALPHQTFVALKAKLMVV